MSNVVPLTLEFIDFRSPSGYFSGSLEKLATGGRGGIELNAPVMIEQETEDDLGASAKRGGFRPRQLFQSHGHSSTLSF